MIARIRTMGKGIFILTYLAFLINILLTEFSLPILNPPFQSIQVLSKLPASMSISLPSDVI